MARSIASDFKNTNVEINLGREIYATAINAMITEVDGNAELSNIIKKQLNTVSKVLQDDSKEIMSKKGMGVIYTKDCDNTIATPSKKYKRKRYNNGTRYNCFSK